MHSRNNVGAPVEKRGLGGDLRAIYQRENAAVAGFRLLSEGCIRKEIPTERTVVLHKAHRLRAVCVAVVISPRPFH